MLEQRESQYLFESEGQLVLTRKVDQGLVLNIGARVKIYGVERDRVKVGVIAPEDVRVLREELLDSDDYTDFFSPEIKAKLLGS